MKRELLQLIRDYTKLNAELADLQQTLEREKKAQKACKTELRRLEKKLAEKMERRAEIMQQTEQEFSVKLSEMISYVVVNDEEGTISLKVPLFGKDYVVFKVDADMLKNASGGEILELLARGVLANADYGVKNLPGAETIIRFNKEIAANPAMMQDKLVNREIERREKSIEDRIKTYKNKISEDRDLLASYEAQLVGKEPVKDNLINRIVHRRQVLAQREIAKLNDQIALSLAKVDGYTEQLEDKATIKEESKVFVEQQFKLMKQVIGLFDYITARKARITNYNARYVKPVQIGIEQQKIAIANSDDIQQIHSANIAACGRKIYDMLVERYKNKDLLEALLTITKKECTPDQWQVITAIKQHYHAYVAKRIDVLLEEEYD